MKKNLTRNFLVISLVIISLIGVQQATAPGQGTPKKLEDAMNNGYLYVNPYYGATEIAADQGSYFAMGWAYLQSEWDDGVFAQPFKYHLYVDGQEVKLHRSATGELTGLCFLVLSCSFENQLPVCLISEE